MDDAELLLTPVGFPSLERGHLCKKGTKADRTVSDLSYVTAEYYKVLMCGHLLNVSSKFRLSGEK